MKKFHEKTILSLASAMLLSSGLLLSTQASAASTQVDPKTARCDVESNFSMDIKTTQPFLIFDSFKNTCRTPRVYFNKGQVAYLYAAVCGNDDKKVPVEAIISIKTDANEGDYDRDYINLSTYDYSSKGTEQQLLGGGRVERFVSTSFTIPVAGYYKANVVTYPDHLKNYDIKNLKKLEIKAMITNTFSEIPNNTNERKSLCANIYI